MDYYTLDNVRILIVDDMKPMLTFLKRVLEIFGFEHVDTASNGEEGYKLLCKNDHDLVIADWNMHPVNGLELCKMIRQNPLTPNPFVPIIIMTGFGSKEKVEQARDMGMTEFLSKPFSPEDLYKRMESIIELPREFVDSQEFFGPDRRRHKNSDYDGPDRRGKR